MRPLRTRHRALVSVVAALLLLAGCAKSGDTSTRGSAPSRDTGTSASLAGVAAQRSHVFDVPVPAVAELDGAPGESDISSIQTEIWRLPAQYTSIEDLVEWYGREMPSGQSFGPFRWCGEHGVMHDPEEGQQLAWEWTTDATFLQVEFYEPEAGKGVALTVFATPEPGCEAP